MNKNESRPVKPLKEGFERGLNKQPSNAPKPPPPAPPKPKPDTNSGEKK